MAGIRCQGRRGGSVKFPASCFLIAASWAGVRGQWKRDDFVKFPASCFLIAASWAGIEYGGGILQGQPDSFDG